ncbi:DUF5686 family protein [Flavobacterium sp.]|uniref:DUF5686 family protein n=1 Tax=Flavobacterium sp. TaxID=239 RepID=UPI001B3D88D2|nr:DUF5686 family protein [Flavobacterium sp.]MBP6127048.1 carboxypeptidase-like regulatory domain-containing protein [Flavobacterium sp.]
MRILVWFIFFSSFVAMAQKTTSKHREATENLVTTIIQLQSKNQIKTPNFSYTFYEKSIVSANPDSISASIDTVFKNKRKMKFIIDSSSYKFKKIITKQHIYQTEKVAKISIEKGKKKETIIGLKMAGLKQPVYELLGQEFMPFDLSKKQLKILQFTFQNPFSTDGSVKYKFEITDTLIKPNGNEIVLQFELKKSIKKNKLKGVAIVDLKTNAITKITFLINSIINVKAETIFGSFNTEKSWFPVSQNILITKGKGKQNIDFLGETIQFDNLPNTSKKYDYSNDLYVKIYRDYSNYNFTQLQNRQRYQIQIDKSAIKKNTAFFNTISNDTLDERSQNTYQTLDSLVTATKIEKKIYFGKKLINGQIPFGWFDFRARDIFKYNSYEGFRLGLGIATNERFSPYYKLFGYGAYGTRDGIFKSQLGSAFRISKNSDSWISGSFTDDIIEFADLTLIADSKKFKLYDPRPFNLSTFYNHQSYELTFESKFISKIETTFKISRSRINPLFDYEFIAPNKSYKIYNLTLATLSLEWSPNSKFLQAPQEILEVEKGFPKIILQVSHAIPNVLSENIEFTKIDARVYQEKKYLSGQKTTFLLQGGISLGNAPLSHLYSVTPNNLDREAILRRVTFANKTSFETMYFNEFFSDRYSLFQMKHYFNKFQISKSIKPTLILGTKVAFGGFTHPENHQGIAFKTMEKGFFESGFELQNIFKGFGLATYYRYGPYQLEKFDQNIAIKLSFTLNLGI